MQAFGKSTSEAPEPLARISSSHGCCLDANEKSHSAKEPKGLQIYLYHHMLQQANPSIAQVRAYSQSESMMPIHARWLPLTSNL